LSFSLSPPFEGKGIKRGGVKSPLQESQCLLNIPLSKIVRGSKGAPRRAGARKSACFEELQKIASVERMADPEHPGDPEVSGEPSEGRRAPPPLPTLAYKRFVSRDF